MVEVVGPAFYYVDFSNPNHDDKWEIGKGGASIRGDAPDGMGRALRCIKGCVKTKDVDISLSKMPDCTVCIGMYLLDMEGDGHLLYTKYDTNIEVQRRIVMHHYMWNNKPFIVVDKSEWDDPTKLGIWEEEVNFVGK